MNYLSPRQSEPNSPQPTVRCRWSYVCVTAASGIPPKRSFAARAKGPVSRDLTTVALTA
jgi:hypothetical protein